MTVSLALGLVGSINSGLRLDAVSGLINKTAVWLLGITTTPVSYTHLGPQLK